MDSAIFRSENCQLIIKRAGSRIHGPDLFPVSRKITSRKIPFQRFLGR